MTEFVWIENPPLDKALTYLKTYTAECTDYLFINKNGDELTRSGVRTRINKLVSQATAQVPSLREKTVTLHTF